MILIDLEACIHFSLNPNQSSFRSILSRKQKQTYFSVCFEDLNFCGGTNMQSDKEQSETNQDVQSNEVLAKPPKNEVLSTNDNFGTKSIGDAVDGTQSQDTVTQEIASHQQSHFCNPSLDTPVSPLSHSLENDRTFENPSKVSCLLPAKAQEVTTSSTALAKAEIRENPQTKNERTMEDDEKRFLNERIVNELLHDTTGTFPDTLLSRNTTSGKLAEIQAQIKSTMEKAFWDGVFEGLARNPPDYIRVVGLVKEVRDELDALVPQSWRQELHESIDVELFSQILESGVHDVEYLSKLLDYALGLVLRLGAPARDNETKAAHEKLVQELSGIVAGISEKSNLSFAHALVRGLRFILEQIQILKQDVSVVRIRALAPLIQGPAGVEYMQKIFTDRYGPVSMATSKLPQTVQWLAQVQESIEKERHDFNDLVEVFKLSQSNIPSPHTTGGIQTEVDWTSMGTLVRLGLLQIASRPVAANEENTPETLKLNTGRLRNTQNDLQRIIVISTGLLLVRQTLAEKEVPTAKIDDVLKRASKQLNDILSDPLITSHHIGQLLAQLCCSALEGEQPGVDEQLMNRVLSRSLSAGDAVFAKVASAVQSSVRTFLLLGKGPGGCLLAEVALKRIGGSSLIDLAVGVADVLEVMASVSCKVHGPWYKNILGIMH